ncbi:MAG: transcriptional regulator, partial [Nonomuraea sp.]|nr:transcriptional regulator [Nonomuraea sp.]
ELDGAGRRVEALEVYQQVRQVLVEELGLEPSPMLRRLHQTLLSDDRPPAPAGRSAVQLAERGAGPPAQLPACIADFSGRKEAVSRVVRRLSPGGTRRPALPVISITGMPGSGKTALALWAAHAVRRYFPDGQFFVGLGGSQDAPVHPWQVIGQFLRAGGVADEQIPEPMDERTTFFRSWSADRSILVVLDDAASDEQVTPLVPAGEESAVIVTGQAPGFADGEIVLLDVFEPEESLELLRRVLGRGRVDRERRAGERIARMCGHLPLALRAAATRLAMMPEWPLAEFAGRLSLSGSRLDELRVGRLDVRSHLAAGYRRLCEQERSLLCLLSGIAQAEFLAPDAAALTGLGLAALEAMLGRLAERRLVHVGYGPGGTPRYSLHELVRAYAREQPAGLSGPTGALTA